MQVRIIDLEFFAALSYFHCIKTSNFKIFPKKNHTNFSVALISFNRLLIAQENLRNLLQLLVSHVNLRTSVYLCAPTQASPLIGPPPPSSMDQQCPVQSALSSATGCTSIKTSALWSPLKSQQPKQFWEGSCQDCTGQFVTITYNPGRA